MRVIRTILAAALLATAGPAGSADRSGDDDEWRIFGRVIALVQSVVHVAAQSNDPRAVERGVESLLSGEHPEANRLAGELFNDAFEDMPPQYRGSVLALAKDIAAIARKERARQPYGPAMGVDGALQARKDLAAMGLRYFDSAQFLDAVKRDDSLAVELFIVGRGVDLGARDADGRNALEIAQRRNNRQLIGLLASAGRR